MNYFILDNKKSLDYGLYITGSGAFNAPERDVETVEVPGRNGNLIIDRGRFKNVIQSYKAFIHKDFAKNAEAARAWLLSSTGYRRLEDTYNPDYFRLARFSGPQNWNVRALCAGGETELLFDCKPQRFLKSGEHSLYPSNGATICNPTLFPALPLIAVYGSNYGTVTVNGNPINIMDLDGHVVIDCELQDAYKGIENKNHTIYLNTFPQLMPGENFIEYSGGITSITLMPRWWTL